MMGARAGQGHDDGSGGARRSPAPHGRPDLGGLWSLRVLFLIAGATGSAFIPFFALLLRDRGLTPERIGLVFAATSLAAAISTPVWSHLADTRLGAIRVLVVSSLGTAAFALVLFVVPSAFWPIVLVAAAMSVCSGPGAPLSDALAVAYLGEERVSEYGRIRLWASLGWGVAVIGFGALYEPLGLGPVLPFYAAGMVVFALWTLRLPPGAPVPVRSESRLGALGDVFRASPRLGPFVAGMVIVSIGVYAALSFVSLRIVGTGGGPFLVGLAAGLAALIEIPVMRWSGAIARRFGLRAVFCVGALCYAVVFLCWTLSRSPLALALVATGDGVAFALVYVGVVVIVGRLVPRRLLSTGQAVTQTFGWSLGAIVGPLIGGFVYARLGAPVLFAGAAALCVVGAAWVWLVLAGTEHAGPGRDLEAAGE
jgi:PPP family 3-phenylpropionic acid transporter